MRRKKRSFPWPVLLVAVLAGSIAGGFYLYEAQLSNYGFPFQCLSQEALTVHIHPYLRIVVNGINITVPAGIGIADATVTNGIAYGGTCFEPIHTHDSSGIIHIESPTNTNYTLGDFFKIWRATYQTITINGVKHPIVFNSTDIFGFKVDKNHKLLLIVDGKESFEYQNLVLNTLDYCNASNGSQPPCYPTATGDPYYAGNPYPYGTGHTIVIEYVSVGS